MTELTPLFAGSARDQWPVAASFKQLGIRDIFVVFFAY